MSTFTEILVESFSTRFRHYNKRGEILFSSRCQPCSQCTVSVPKPSNFQPWTKGKAQINSFFIFSVQITSRYKQWAQSTSPILFQSKSCCSISNTSGLWVIMLLSSFWTRLFRHPTVNRGRFNIKYLYSPCWPFRLFSGCVLLANKAMVSPLLLPLNTKWQNNWGKCWM